VNHSIPVIRMDTTSLFKKTVPEVINKDESTGKYNIQSAVSITLY